MAVGCAPIQFDSIGFDDSNRQTMIVIVSRHRPVCGTDGSCMTGDDGKNRWPVPDSTTCSTTLIECSRNDDGASPCNTSHTHHNDRVGNRNADIDDGGRNITRIHHGDDRSVPRTMSVKASKSSSQVLLKPLRSMQTKPTRPTSRIRQPPQSLSQLRSRSQRWILYAGAILLGFLVLPSTASPVHPVSWAARDAFRKSFFSGRPYRSLTVGGHNMGSNSLLAMGTKRRLRRQLRSSSTQLQFWEHFFPVLDVIEPLETVWEWYVKRDEIMDSLMDSGVAFLRRKSVQVVGVLVVSLCIAEGLTWAGVLHPSREMEEHESRRQGQDQRRQRKHFWHLFSGNDDAASKPKSESKEWMEEAIEEKFFKRTGSFLINTAMRGFGSVRHWNPKSKFALSMTVGSFSSRALLRVTTAAVRVGIVSFVTLETLSFLGIIGERGESILAWIDEYDDTEEFKHLVRKTRHFCSKYLSPDGMLNLYEYSVDEEKIATFGFALGSVIGILT
mmetsp:Transcript_1986/g.4895  ORF Transcript_1986/g.4895 Transcript_1986/m.4895 type:complete len:500 (+) Transcript_1986:67-1566(+)